MAPFEVLYGRKCRTPLFWNQIGEIQVFKPEVLQEAKKIGTNNEAEFEGCTVSTEELC